MEDIARGENIREYRLSGLQNGKWEQIAAGTCIGHKRIEVLKKESFSAVKLEVLKSAGIPAVKSISCY